MRFSMNPEPIAGMSAILQSQQVHSILDGIGGRVAAIAQATGPRDTGHYISQIGVEDGGLVLIDRYERTSVNVVARAPYSSLLEAKHHTLQQAAEAVAASA